MCIAITDLRFVCFWGAGGLRAFFWFSRFFLIATHVRRVLCVCAFFSVEKEGLIATVFVSEASWLFEGGFRLFFFFLVEHRWKILGKLLF